MYSSTSCCFQVNISFSIFCDLLILSPHWSLRKYPLSAWTRNSSSAQFQSKVVNKKIVTRKVSNKVSTSDRFPLYTQFIQGLGEKGWGQLCGRHFRKLSCLLGQRDKLSSNSKHHFGFQQQIQISKLSHFLWLGIQISGPKNAAF